MLATYLSKYDNAGQVRTPSRAFLPKTVLDCVPPLKRKQEFLKGIAFIVMPAVPYAGETDQRIRLEASCRSMFLFTKSLTQSSSFLFNSTSQEALIASSGSCLVAKWVRT